MNMSLGIEGNNITTPTFPFHHPAILPLNIPSNNNLQRIIDDCHVHILIAIMPGNTGNYGAPTPGSKPNIKIAIGEKARARPRVSLQVY